MLRLARREVHAAEVRLCGLQRQFHRLVEMLVLKHTDEADARAMKAYRLQVKERLYRFNYVRALVFLRFAYAWMLTSCMCLQEVLMQLEKPERQQKLEETFQSVREDYGRILALVR